MGQSAFKLPRRVVVTSVIRARYTPGERPVRWEDRVDGIEVVAIAGGEELQLYSSGGQSSPAPGWELLLDGVAEISGDEAFNWTLYGIQSR